MRLTQLRSFHAVARAGGFTGAARLLHISQPTVTTQVRFLEETYGIELFYRRGRTVKLTPLGEQLYELAQRVFALEGETIHLLQDSGELRSGSLRVGAVGPFHVTEMLARFNQRYPQMQVSVRVGNSTSVLEELLEYRTDVAVLAQYTHDARFHSMPYSRHPVVVFMHKGHRLAGRKSIRLADLDGEPMILREEGSTTRKAFDDAMRRSGVKPRVVMEIGGREAIREAVIMGVGLGTVSEVEYIPHRDIRHVRIADADIFTHAHVVCLGERRDARLVHAFFDIARELRQVRASAGSDNLGKPPRRENPRKSTRTPRRES
jgi:LysR family transcriptional regulator, low CO2-responsive transcriptional regulator